MGRRGFTLIEGLVIVAVIAAVAVVAILIIDPKILFQQSRDTRRIADLNQVNTAINAVYSLHPGFSFGSSSVYYLSLIDPTATTSAGTDCSGLGFPSGGTYHCAASSSVYNVDGTGWIPVNFTKVPGSGGLSKLPVDPVNTSSSGDFYVYVASGCRWKLESFLESKKYQSLEANDPGCAANAYQVGDFQLPGLTKATSATVAYIQDTYSSNHFWYFFAQFSYPSGTMSETWTGDYAVMLNGPTTLAGAVAVDASGSIFNVNNYPLASYAEIQKFGADRSYVLSFGSYGSGVGQMVNPQGIAVDKSGNVFVVDSGNNRVEKWVPNGNSYVNSLTFSTLTGLTPSQFNAPEGIAVDAVGDLYVVDAGNGRVVKCAPNDQSYRCTSFASAGAGLGQLSSPKGISLDPVGNVWVADYGNKRIDRFTTAGNYVGNVAVSSGNPWGVGADSGCVYFTSFIYFADSCSWNNYATTSNLWATGQWQPEWLAVH